MFAARPARSVALAHSHRPVPCHRGARAMRGHGRCLALPAAAGGAPGQGAAAASSQAAQAASSSNGSRNKGHKHADAQAGSSGAAAEAGDPGSSQGAPPPAAAARQADAAAGGSQTAACSAGGGDVEVLRAEVSELRQLLIAQARLVQSQQRHITQLEAAVGQAVVQQTAASTAAAAAAEAAAAAAAAVTHQQHEAHVAAASGSGSSSSSSAASNGAGSGSPLILLGGGSGQAAGLSGAAAGGSHLIEGIKAEEARHNRKMQDAQMNDRRLTGLFDARYHSTSTGATPRDFRVLPRRIFLVRHAESEGNVDNVAYTYLPDPRVPLTARGWQQAMAAGDKLKSYMDDASGEGPYKLFFYTSPYLRSRQTYEGLAMAFSPEQVQGVQEEVQLREQDFGNFQDAEGKKREKAERLRFGRFFYRFPNGESGADVYDRMTLFEDHLVRDINAGRFAGDTSLVLVTHGLALRIFLMRWFHWTVDQFMSVFNPPNAEPLVLERVPSDFEARQGGPVAWIHTKALYRLSQSSREIIKGCTEEMCQTSWAPRRINPLDPADRLLLPDNYAGGPSVLDVEGQEERAGQLGA